MRLCFSSILCGVCELFPWEYVAIWCWISLERPLTYLPNEDYGVTDARCLEPTCAMGSTTSEFACGHLEFSDTFFDCDSQV